MSSFNAVAVFAFLAGLGSHQVFRKFEPTISSFIVVFLCLQTTACLLYTQRTSITIRNLVSVGQTVAVFDLIYLTTLGISITLYRVYFHPLRRFPGPKLSRISKIEWWYRIRNGHFYQHVEQLHKKYGDVVRVGPNDLAFCDPRDAPLINGPSSKMSKGPHADGSPWAKARSVTFIKDRTEHRARRRIWDQGFTTVSLQNYEPRIAALIEELSNQFAIRGEHEIDFAAWASFFAFDTMGDLGFGTDFGMVEKGVPHIYREYIHKALRMRTIWNQLPWCKYIVGYLPMDSQMKKDTQEFVKFGNERFMARKAQGTTRADIFSHLLAQDQDSGGKMTEAELKEDTKAIIIAGSDTTSFALTALFFYLVQDHQAYENVQREADALNAQGPVRGTTLGPEQAPYINGAIHEALRLFPPAPELSQRTYGKSSLTLNGKYIPPSTHCYVSVYTMHKDPRNFSEPEKFMPERWIEKARPEKFNHSSKAFAPFGSGLYGCAGKTLAMLEMRQFVATLLHRFQFSAGPSFSREKFLASLRSNGTMESRSLPIMVAARDVKKVAV